jgi:hypothetical protein
MDHLSSKIERIAPGHVAFLVAAVEEEGILVEDAEQLQANLRQYSSYGYYQ